MATGYYRYYDTPDGTDFFKKEYILVRKAFPFGAYYAWFDVIARSKPVGWLPCVVRFAASFVQPLICVSLYNVTVFMSTRLRGKDDPINHMLAVYPVAWYSRKTLGGPTALMFAIPLSMLAFGIKHYKMIYPKYNFFQEPSTHRENRDNTIFADFFSYSMLQVREKNWLPLEEAIKRGIVQSKEEAQEKKLTNYNDGQARGLIRLRDGSEFTSKLR